MQYITKNSILLLFIFVYNNFRKNKDVRMTDVPYLLERAPMFERAPPSN